MQKKECGDFNWRYWLYIPNLVSLSRFITTSVYLWAAVKQKYAVAVIFIVISMGSDVLDGWLARKLNQCTKLGLVLDPAGDYYAFLLTSIVFAYFDIIPQYVAAIIAGYIIFKLVWIIFFYVNNEKIDFVQARKLSKITTGVLALVLVIYFLLSIPVSCISLFWQNSWLSLQNGLQAVIFFINILAIFFVIATLVDYYLESNFHKIFIKKLLE